MNEYLLIIRGGEDVSANKSPEEMQAHMQDWQKWMGGLADEGKFVAGQPLMNEAKSMVDKGKRVIDRPLAEGKELVAGYIILKASSIEEATELSKACPGFDHDCTLEIREIRPMG